MIFLSSLFPPLHSPQSKQTLQVFQPEKVRDAAAGGGRDRLRLPQAKLSSFFSSSLPKIRLPKTPDPFSSSTVTTISTNSLWDTSLTATTASSPLMSLPSLSPYYSAESPKQRPNKKTTKAKAKKKGLVEEGMAVVKESSDPYLDFRDSMLQMIVEMEIYAWDDLRDLLHRFLALNSPCHHHLILQAFAEIWTGVFSTSSSSSSSSFSSTAASGSRPGRRRR